MGFSSVQSPAGDTFISGMAMDWATGNTLQRSLQSLVLSVDKFLLTHCPKLAVCTETYHETMDAFKGMVDFQIQRENNPAKCASPAENAKFVDNALTFFENVALYSENPDEIIAHSARLKAIVTQQGPSELSFKLIGMREFASDEEKTYSFSTQGYYLMTSAQYERMQFIDDLKEDIAPAYRAAVTEYHHAAADNEYGANNNNNNDSVNRDIHPELSNHSGLRQRFLSSASMSSMGSMSSLNSMNTVHSDSSASLASTASSSVSSLAPTNSLGGYQEQINKTDNILDQYKDILAQHRLGKA
ncbi:hypothetical protein [uncultured Shewanella sp.]|uniref:hypothetical protein n=1 Tax=uncultured Shewanella sp. TaxID=173975 RepID=UPI0026051D88|nr:hypothetical protein [uncultured Shewanella sp.]